MSAATAHGSALRTETRCLPLLPPIGISSADHGAIVGGLYGYSSYQWLFVQVLAVPESLRGQGWASWLLGMAEEQAVERGCVGVWLDTHNPDAKRNYEQ